MIGRTAFAAVAAAAALFVPSAPAFADDPYGAPQLSTNVSSLCIKNNTPVQVTLTDSFGRSWGQVSALTSGRTPGVKIDGGNLNPSTKPLSAGVASWSVVSSRPGQLVLEGRSSFDGFTWSPASTLTIPVVANGRCN